MILFMENLMQKLSFDEKHLIINKNKITFSQEIQFK